MQWSCHVLPCLAMSCHFISFYQEQPRCAECWENHSIGLLPTWSHLVATQVHTTLSQLSQLVARATLPPILSTLTHRCRCSHHHISLPAQLVKQNGSANRRFWTKHSGILDAPPGHQKKIAHVLEKWSVFPMFVSFFWIFMNLYDNYGQTDQWFSIHKSIQNSPLRELHCDPLWVQQVPWTLPSLGSRAVPPATQVEVKCP